MRIKYTAENNTGIITSFNYIDNGSNSHAARSIPINKGLMTLKVSAVIITYNEELIIQETLSRLWWCDEIIIIDSGSTDKTVGICEQYGCSVYYQPFKGFGEQKNHGVSKAKNDWILCIDADEVLTEELIDEIRKELATETIPYSGFSVPRNLVFMNKVFKYGKEADSSIIRLFNKTKGKWDGAVVHEKVCLEGSVKQLNNKILHYSYKDYSHFLDKINLYSTLGAQKLYAKNARKGKFITTLGLPFNFFKYYLIDRNFMNGYRGFAWAVLNSIYHFMKYLKLRELKDQK